MKYYFIRHGESESNKLGILANVKVNPSLSKKGREQAENMQQVMKDVFLEKIYVSPLMRARETAAIVFPGRELIIENDLTETNVGFLDGKSVREPAVWKSYKAVIDSWEKGNDSVRYQDGESNEDVKARLKKVLAGVNKENKESVAFVAHADLFRSFFWSFCENHGKTLQENFMSNAHLTVVSRETGSSIYRIDTFNTTKL